MRYEIKNITPPHDVLAAMEKRMRAEREKRALILARKNVSETAWNPRFSGLSTAIQI
jgi:regulator of protease activity HflC (stomatin/prohibitin superfamily)